jgi:hypothetical protein
MILERGRDCGVGCLEFGTVGKRMNKGSFYERKILVGLLNRALSMRSM